MNTTHSASAPSHLDEPTILPSAKDERDEVVRFLRAVEDRITAEGDAAVLGKRFAERDLCAAKAWLLATVADAIERGNHYHC